MTERGANRAPVQSQLDTQVSMDAVPVDVQDPAVSSAGHAQPASSIFLSSDVSVDAQPAGRSAVQPSRQLPVQQSNIRPAPLGISRPTALDERGGGDMDVSGGASRLSSTSSIGSDISAAESLPDDWPDTMYGAGMDAHNQSGSRVLSASSNNLSESTTSLSNPATTGTATGVVTPQKHGAPHKQNTLQKDWSIQLDSDGRIMYELLENCDLQEDVVPSRVRDIIGHLERLEDYDSHDGENLQWMLWNMYNDYEPLRETIADTMVLCGYAPVSMKMLTAWNSIGTLENAYVYFPTYYTYDTMAKFTHYSPKLAQALAENDAVRLLTLNCGLYLNKSRKNVVDFSLCILHHISRNHRMKHYFDDYKTSETIMPILKSEDDDLCIPATFLILNIVDEEEYTTCFSETGTVRSIVTWIEKALNHPRRLYKGFFPEELTDGLNKLAVNDSNKMMILDEGALPLFLRMLLHDDVGEQASAARVIGTLASDKIVRQKIIDFPDIVATLKKCTDSTTILLQINASGALSVIGVEIDVTRQSQRFLNMTTQEKRQYYKCGNDFLISQQIPSWQDTGQMTTAGLSKSSDGHFDADAVINDKVALWHGDITRLEMDAIVSSTSSPLKREILGVDAVICTNAGPFMNYELDRLYRGVFPEEIAITSGYCLPAKFVMHTSCLPSSSKDEGEEVLGRCYKTALDAMKENGLRTMAIPFVSTRGKELEGSVSANVALKTTRRWLEENHSHVDKIVFCIDDHRNWQAYQKIMPEIFPVRPYSGPKLATLPAEIIRMDDQSIQLYKKALSEGETSVHSIRVMVVGHYDVGKTTLTRRLLEEDVDIDARDSTNGIDVHVRRCRVSLADQSWTVLKKGDKVDTTLKKLADVLSKQSSSARNEEQVISEGLGELNAIPSPHEDTTELMTVEEQMTADDTQTKSDGSDEDAGWGEEESDSDSDEDTDDGSDEDAGWGEEESDSDSDEDNDAMMGVNTQQPKHPHYAIKSVRLRSYAGWPKDLTQTPDVMAGAGYYYDGFADSVTCFFCGIGLHHWMPMDNVWVEHARWSPQCVYLRQMKGQEFIDLVKIRFTVEDVSEESAWTVSKPQDVGKKKIDSEAVENAVLKDLKDVISNIVPSDEEDYAYLSLWDYAGQNIFYSTHQMFLSSRAIYLLVTDISKHIEDVVGDDVCYFDVKGKESYKISEFVNLWTNSIHCCCPLDKPNVPPIILVGTHSDRLDQATKEEQENKYFEAVRNIFNEKVTARHVVDKDFSINNAIIDPNLAALKQKIFEVATRQDYWGEKIPVNWLMLERALGKLSDKGRKIITHNELMDVNNLMPVPIASEYLDLFLRFQHESGNILYFNDPDLRDNILLHPQWLIDCLKSLITAKMFCSQPQIAKQWKELHDNGILRPDLIDAVWQQEGNQSFQEHRGHLVLLMEKLNIIAPSDGDDSGRYHLVPCMLKDPPTPVCIKSDCVTMVTTPVLCITTADGFLHAGIFQRLLAACIGKWKISKQGKKNLIHCGYGCFDVDDFHRVMLYFRDCVIQMWVTRYGVENPQPSAEVCAQVRGYVEQELQRISTYLAQLSNLKLSIKCLKCRNLEEIYGQFSVEDLLEHHRENDKRLEICHAQEESSHPMTCSDLLRHWYGNDLISSIQDNHYHSVLFPDTLEEVPSDKQLNQIASKIGKEYEQLGLALGLPQVEIDRIKIDNPYNVLTQTVNILLSWRRKNASRATFHILEQAMVTVHIDAAVALAGISSDVSADAQPAGRSAVQPSRQLPVQQGNKRPAPLGSSRPISTNSSGKKKRAKVLFSGDQTVVPPAEERKRFVSEYGKEDQPGVQATDDAKPKPGNFVLLGREPCMPVFDEGIKFEVAKSVGIIYGPHGTTGTGFRVGPNFIMTAYHVVHLILEEAKKDNYRPVTEPNPSPEWAALGRPDIYIYFGFLQEGIQPDMKQRFFFKPCVHSHDPYDCDFAVLELRDNDVGGTMPERFTSFADPKPNGLFHLIGHSGGKRKHFAPVEGIIDLNREDNKKLLTEARQWSKDLVKDEHGRDGYLGADNPHRVLFRCDFEQGASGSPGIVVKADGRAVVVTMLVYGFPDWLYDDKVAVMVKQQCTSSFRIEQGTKLRSIYDYMSQSGLFPAALAVRDAIFGNPDGTLLA